MIAGSISAQKPSMKDQTISRSDFRGGLPVCSPRATHHQAKQSPTPSMRPGKMPGREGSESAKQPEAQNRTRRLPGGITGPMTPLAATSPVAYVGRGPAATIMGTSRAASAAASAAADPDSEDSTQAARIVT